MARYRKIDVRMWGDAKFRRLTPPQPCGQALWWYLLTNPNTTNIPGLYRAGESQIAEELGWPMKGFREAFQEVSAQGLVEVDWDARLVWIPGAMRYHVPESPNVVKSWATTWDELPECDLKTKAFHLLKAFTEGLGEAFQAAFAKALPNPSLKPSGKAMANQEQEQEQEQKEEKTVGLAPVDVLSGPEPNKEPERTAVGEVLAHYQRLHPKHRPIARDSKLVRDRLKEGYSAADLIQAIDGYHRSPFHQGQNERGQKYLALELLLRDNKHVTAGIELADRPATPIKANGHHLPVHPIRDCDFHRGGRNTGRSAPRHEFRADCAECRHAMARASPRSAGEPSGVGELLSAVVEGRG